MLDEQLIQRIEGEQERIEDDFPDILAVDGPVHKSTKLGPITNTASEVPE